MARGLVALLVVLGLILAVYYFYFRQQPGVPERAPAQIISLTGVQNDLLAIAQAERFYQAENGSYASLEQLVAGGALTIPRNGRDGYAYSVELTPQGFRVTARYTGPASGYPTLSVDQTLEIRRSE